MTQNIHEDFFAMTEIGRITMSEALSCLYSFVTLKNLRTLLRVTPPPFFLALLLLTRFITIYRYTCRHITLRSYISFYNYPYRRTIPNN
ncbi:hypothetical protein EDC94DRAFT_602400 [Helicostylum pulchrum]|nr:hypothetical protein EDC94DRAFT_602400 [Helicostylum pulchrum]